MKQKHNGGFSLIETLVAITVLALIVVPTCTSLVMSHRINAKTEEMMQAQLAVSSAVEMLMAEGITDEFLNSLTDPDPNDGDTYKYTPKYQDVKFLVSHVDGVPYYTVEISSEDGMVSVTTSIREKGGGA